jgi:hypothetical protein
MKRFLPILVLVCLGCFAAEGSPQSQAVPASSQAAPEAAPPQGAPKSENAKPENAADANARKAKALIDQAIEALGGQNYLNIRDREAQGRGYSFHHGRPSGAGSIFWSFAEFPDKERVEYTKERDIARVYAGNKAYEITYKGPKQIDEKERQDYLRLRQFSLDSILRTWINEPGVILLYEGNALAAQHETVQVSVINTKNESVTLYRDADTHLPVKKSFEWRDPVDRQKNLEEEVYENYRPVSGIMAPYNVTRYFNGDMSNQRFLNSVTINQGLDQAMFDANSGYNPNKPAGKR